MKKPIFIFCLLFCFLQGGYDIAGKPTKRSSSLPTNIQNVNFFLETSASMAGYFNGSTEFSQVIPNLLVNIEGNVLSAKKPLQIYYVADSIIPYKKSTSSFIGAISTTKIAKSKSSEMHTIFENIARKTKANDISIFVSDCILSYPNAIVKASPQINRQKAPGALKALIKATFMKLKKQNVSVSLYGFNSKFFGDYYTYENQKLILNGDIRPYYVWVIGNKELVEKFNGQMANMSSFKPIIKMDFGLFDKTSTVTDQEIFFAYKRAGDWEVDGKEISNAKVSKNVPLEFAFAFNLNSLPPYAQKVDYINKKINKLTKNVGWKINSIVLAKEINKAQLKPNEVKLVQNNSHVAVVEITGLYDKNAVLGLRLPLIYDDLYKKKLSVMDDRNLKSLQNKTFAFEHLVDGVREAYENPNDNFINITIPIKN
jgi:hypothetical protein